MDETSIAILIAALFLTGLGTAAVTFFSILLGAIRSARRDIEDDADDRARAQKEAERIAQKPIPVISKDGVRYREP